jgi:2',5'-phosphodiesterase
VTYNILADLYTDSEYTRKVLHPYCPPYALAIDYRKQLILKELIGKIVYYWLTLNMLNIVSVAYPIIFHLGYNADIICLQEVDGKVFDSDLKPIFSSLGFGAEFSKKGGQVSEGMTCLFNTSKFRLVESCSHILAEELPKNPLVNDLWEAVQKNEDLSKRIIDRTTSCHLLVLESLFNGKRIVVANTHLYFHPNADHIRLLQSCVALRLAQNLRNCQLVRVFIISPPLYIM